MNTNEATTGITSGATFPLHVCVTVCMCRNTCKLPTSFIYHVYTGFFLCYTLHSKYKRGRLLNAYLLHYRKYGTSTTQGSEGSDHHDSLSQPVVSLLPSDITIYAHNCKSVIWVWLSWNLAGSIDTRINILSLVTKYKWRFEISLLHVVLMLLKLPYMVKILFALCDIHEVSEYFASC